MLSRQKRTDIRKLSSKKHRVSSGQFIAEGRRSVEQILRNGRIRVTTVITDGREAPQGAGTVDILTRAEFDALRTTEHSQGVIAICERPLPLEVADLVRLNGVILAFDGLQDPGNLGTLIRTAAWFGVAGVFLGNGTADPFQPKVVRSTAGATGAIPYAMGDLTRFLKEAAKAGRAVLLLDGGPGAIPMQDLRPDPSAVLVLGNEGNGLSAEIRSAGYRSVAIQGRTEFVESLNAAVAGAIALHHMSHPHES
jgi:TrmH family RNA methyltransferase